MADEIEHNPDDVLEVSPREEIIGGTLSPRHRRVAQLIASGQTFKVISEQTGFSYQTIRGLAHDPRVQAEVHRFQDKMFELSIKDQLKDFKGKALENIHWILNDDTGRVNVAQKADMSKWLVEQLDGKAVQKHELGENSLAIFMDEIDKLKGQGSQGETIDVTPTALLPERIKEVEEEKEMKEWVNSL